MFKNKFSKIAKPERIRQAIFMTSFRKKISIELFSVLPHAVSEKKSS